LVGRQSGESFLDGGMAHATGLSARALNRGLPRVWWRTDANAVTRVNEPVPKGGATTHRTAR